MTEDQLMDATVPYIIYKTLSPGIFKDPMKWCHYFLNVMHFL